MESSGWERGSWERSRRACWWFEWLVERDAEARMRAKDLKILIDMVLMMLMICRNRIYWGSMRHLLFKRVIPIDSSAEARDQKIEAADGTLRIYGLSFDGSSYVPKEGGWKLQCHDKTVGVVSLRNPGGSRAWPPTST